MALIMIHGTDHTFRQTGHVEFVVAYVGCHIGARSSPNVFSSVLEWPVEENRLTKFVFRINQKQKSRVHLNPKTLLRFHLVRMHFLTIYCCRYCFFLFISPDRRVNFMSFDSKCCWWHIHWLFFFLILFLKIFRNRLHFLFLFSTETNAIIPFRIERIKSIR